MFIFATSQDRRSAICFVASRRSLFFAPMLEQVCLVPVVIRWSRIVVSLYEYITHLTNSVGARGCQKPLRFRRFEELL